MKPLATWAGIVVMAVATLAMTAPSAAARGSHHRHSHHWRHHYHHHHRHNYGAALGLGLLSGVIVGDALAGPYGLYPYGTYGYRYVPRPAYRVYYPPRYYRYPSRRYRPHRLSRAHVRWCYAHYRSYRASDNTFQPYHGPRRACISPYG